VNEKCIRILIVDDRREVRQGLATIIQLAASGAEPGLSVIGEAENGLEALAQLSSLRPDVVLMDLEMPGLDGYETTRRIKAINPAVRVIMVSIHAGAEIQQQSRAAGADGFVTKGDSYERFITSIRGEKPIFYSSIGEQI